MTNPMPSPEEMAELGAEIERDAARGRPAAMSKGNRSYEWNESVYAEQRGRPEASDVAQRFGLDLAGRTARNSWQGPLSESGEAIGNFSQPFDVLPRSEAERLRRVARTSKGRRRLQLLVGALRDAELA